MTKATLLEYALDLYKAIKVHEDEIMPKRPDGTPRAAWRMENSGPSTFFRVMETSEKPRPRQARINADTKPILEIYSLSSTPKLIERFDLGKVETIDTYALPESNDMTGDEMRAIRTKLDLPQKQLADILDLANAIRVSEYENVRRAIPTHIARLMRAYEGGWRPTDWPTNK